MSELSEAINEMRNMREAYDQLGAAAEAYNTGKTELAANITAKGVPASAAETIPELAEKVSAIAQESYTIDGGEMYAKQLFGSLETPNYWNLYEVLENLLSDGRLVNYGGILLAEYYRGYDSLVLAGAGSGGAYVVSDKDAQGNFIMYTEDTTHVWDTAFDGKGNRWVAYCFADEYHDFQITDTNTSPRSIFIGRKVGTITALVAHRLSQLVVTDGNELGGYVGNSFATSWDKKVILKLGRLAASNTLEAWTNSAIRSENIESLYIDADIVSPPIASRECTNLSTVILKGNFSSSSSMMICSPNLKTFVYTPKDGNAFLYIYNTVDFQDLIIYDIERSYAPGFDVGFCSGQMKSLYLNYKNNDKSLTVNARIRVNSSIFMTSLQRLVLKNGWCKPLIADTNTSLSEENIYTYILQRLKQDEPDCGDGVTITLGSTNLAKLTSAESVALLDLLTNTYGYTFA